jgi:hypothetical protein
VIEHAEDYKDSGRRVIPYHTGKVSIGRSYIPKPTATDAVWLEHHTRRRIRYVRWMAWAVVAILTVALFAKVS